MSLKIEPECTPRCRSTQHGDIISSLLTLRSLKEEEMASYMRTICANYCQVLDSRGCTALHMAATCGHSKIVDWLCRHKECNINAKDIESGYTALHRSLYCGQINAAVNLIKHGANMTIVDSENLTALEHVMKDRVGNGSALMVQPSLLPCEVYVWGTNNNFTLGTTVHSNRQFPESIEYFRKQAISIRQVVMSKFHSVFVSCEGHAYSCGHGQGGRLGLNTEKAMLTPTRIKIACPPNQPKELCVLASVSRDHTILMTDTGNVLTCGLNTHHQLGITPPPPFVLSPQMLPRKTLQPIRVIMGICAARFHTVIWGSHGVLTCGLHAGQLGHAQTPEKENTIVKPRIVSPLIIREGKITQVAASDGATVAVTGHGDIYVLHEYQCRKIASRQTGVVKVVVVGGHLDPRLDKENLIDRGGETLQVLVLMRSGELQIWQETSPQLVKCVFSINRFIRLRDIAMNHSHILFVTWDSEAFQGELKLKKAKKIAPNQSSPKAQAHPVLERKDCEMIMVTRIPYAHRAVNITSDMKGRNFAILQIQPRQGMLPESLPRVGETSFMRKQMNLLLLEASEDDTIHDVVFEVGHQSFPAHRLMVVSKSKYLKQLIEDEEVKSGRQEVTRVRLEGITPDMFRNVLQYIYTNQCLLNTPATLQTPTNKAVEVYLELNDGKLRPPELNDGKSRPPESMTPESPESVSAYSVYSARNKHKKKIKSQCPESNLYNIKSSILSSVKEIWSKYGLPEFRVTDKNLSILEPTSFPKWNRIENEDFCDMTIRCENGKELRVHKSLLVSRVEYFHSMLCRGWRETSQGSNTLNLSLPYNALKLLVDFLYEDELSLDRKEMDDIELLSNLLVLADQLFVERLKEMCELLISNLVTLKNAAELLQLAETYNARRLSRFCFEFATINMNAILEARSMEGLSSDVLNELSNYYRHRFSWFATRIVTPFTIGPIHEVVREIFTIQPLAFDSEDCIPILQIVCNKRVVKQAKRKVATRKNSTGETKSGHRTRNESNSSVGSEDFDQDIKPLCFDDLVEKSPRLIDDILTVDCKENIEKNSQWIKISSNSKQQKILQARLRAISLGRDPSFCAESMSESFTTLTRNSQGSPAPAQAQTSSPIRMPTQAEQMPPAEPPPGPITSTDFPALGTSPPSHSGGHHHRTEKTPKVKPFKLSQKQRKRLMSGNDNLDGLHQKPPLPAWKLFSKEMEVTPMERSLADVMREEVRLVRSLPINITQQPGSPVEDGCRKPTNPWTRLGTPENSPQRDGQEISFTKILADEKKSKDNLTKMLSKSLDLTQIEDQAITDLLQFYNAAGATEERITVERVITGPIAVPRWITSRI